MPKEKWEALIDENTVKGNDAKTAENLERVLAKVIEAKGTPDKLKKM